MSKLCPTKPALLITRHVDQEFDHHPVCYKYRLKNELRPSHRADTVGHHASTDAWYDAAPGSAKQVQLAALTCLVGPVGIQVEEVPRLRGCDWEACRGTGRADR